MLNAIVRGKSAIPFVSAGGSQQMRETPVPGRRYPPSNINKSTKAEIIVVFVDKRDCSWIIT
jgi:hypothetical protein